MRLRFVPALMAMTMAGLAAVPTVAQSTSYPLTIDNCGVKVTFQRAPTQIVSLGQAMHEIMFSLGLGDRISATAVWLGPVMEQFAAENAAIPRISDESPSFESVLAKEPQLVLSEFEWHVGPLGAVGTREQFAELGIPTYIAPMDCVAKNNSAGGNGMRLKMFTMDLVYQAISDLAAIFDVQESGQELIAQLRTREAEAVKSVAAAIDLPVLFWFTSPEVEADASVAGRNGAPHYMLEVLGARNVIQSEEEWPFVDWETIVRADPAVIVLADMDRRFNPGDDPAARIAFLKSDPVVSHLDAVKQDRYFLMRAEAMNPSIRTIGGIEQLAAHIVEYGLADDEH
jgi:iron complex transport system substrate-binding protein